MDRKPIPIVAHSSSLAKNAPACSLTTPKSSYTAYCSITNSPMRFELARDFSSLVGKRAKNLLTGSVGGVIAKVAIAMLSKTRIEKSAFFRRLGLRLSSSMSDCS